MCTLSCTVRGRATHRPDTGQIPARYRIVLPQGIHPSRRRTERPPRRLRFSFSPLLMISTEDIRRSIRGGLDGVKRQGNAEPGDKTIVDAIPPVEALEQAAREGMEATIPMVAKKGRASYLGERSKGHQAPGATSSYYLFETAAQSLCPPDRCDADAPGGCLGPGSAAYRHRLSNCSESVSRLAWFVSFSSPTVALWRMLSSISFDRWRDPMSGSTSPPE